jgi:tRNA-splicing ligase RtcB
LVDYLLLYDIWNSYNISFFIYTSMSNIFGQHDLKTIEQFKKIEEYAAHAALMSDGHVGYVMPVGGVAAFDNKVSVIGVGFDIACGNCAIKTNLKLEDISRNKWTLRDITHNPHLAISDKRLNQLADEIAAQISFGIGRSNLADDAPVDDALFLDHAWYLIPNTDAYRDTLKEKARDQLGTVGSGNHYVDVFVEESDTDSNGTIWVGNHFGSRGLGHTIATNFLAIGQGGTWGDKGKETETLLDLSTQNGKDYWTLMELCGKYAYVGREWVARKVVSILGGTEVNMVHNNHNFAWREPHFGAMFVVVRKGATPAWPTQRGFVGGSMGDNAVILQGTPMEQITNDQVLQIQTDALFSTVHGAGRVMSRTEAAGKFHRRKKKYVTRGKISLQMMEDWLDKKGVIRRGGGMDEAPQAYRRLPDVLKAQGDTIQILHSLKPLIVVMADPEAIDPYKD